MNGYSSHTYKWVNAKGEQFYVKYTFKTEAGIKNFTGIVCESCVWLLWLLWLWLLLLLLLLVVALRVLVSVNIVPKSYSCTVISCVTYTALQVQRRMR